MVTATTSRTNTIAAVTGGAFTTISERVSLERDIKKSKFIALAGHIPDERSAQSFLSEVIKYNKHFDSRIKVSFYYVNNIRLLGCL